MADEPEEIEYYTIKAAGDFVLDVLGVPFGGQNGGKDSDGEYFSERTNLYKEHFKTVPVFYYHGFTPDGKPQGDPIVIGTAQYSHKDAKGHWYRVILDKANEYAKRVWEAARKGLARASSGALAHLVRKAQDGELLNWALAELSVFDTDKNRQPANTYAVAVPAAKLNYRAAGLDLPELTDGLPDDMAATKKQERNMEPNEIQDLISAELAKADAARAKKAEAEKAESERIDAAVKAEKAKWEAEAAANNRLPQAAPYATKFADTNVYDGLSAGDLAVMMETIKSAGKQVSQSARKALAIKLTEDKSEVGDVGVKAMKAAGIAVKANELDYSTLSSYGDEWVGVAYSTALWESIRIGTSILAKLPQIEVPAGMESIYLPLESTDPTWYKVAEATSSATGYAGPTPTVTASKLGTDRVQMTLAKLGARVVWTGELDESSLIPFASQLRAQLGVSGAEYLESALIDGDTETGASTNINDIDGTAAATDWFMVWNGFRKSPLVTTTTNSRSAGGSLDVTDYLETVKLMGTAGKNGLDRSKVGFIIDPATYYKTLQLSEVLTRDVFVSPTLEGGAMTGLWGYPIHVSGQICKNGGAGGLSENTGKCDETAADNTYGQILAVRWDQWKFGWRRKMTMETTRWAASDTNEIVAMIRCGLIQRDTEASAITYYVGV